MNLSANRKIVFVAGIHGNERMPVKALTEAGKDFILGSPKAYEHNARFVEKDLNASFGVPPDSYESKRAEEILQRINEEDLVVDFHTTESEHTPFVIIVDEKMIPLAERTGIERVVIMKHNIKRGHALINHRDGISIEAGAHTDQRSYNTTLDVINNINKKRKYPTHLYEVYGEITEPGEYINFQEHQAGFIPILANESEYERQGLFGLKARKLTDIICL